MPLRLIAVLDIGKTNTKLILVEAVTGDVVWTVQRPSEPRKGDLIRQLDVQGIEAWLLESLAAAPQRGRIGAIVPVTHGAAAVLIDAAGEVVAAPDYEDPVCDEVAEAYAAERDPFADTLSPRLPLGLNLGRQLFFLQQRQPEAFARVAAILLYPQYWAWRLSGVMASEVTSLGCHTDLWRPVAGRFSALAERRGWAALLPKLRRAGDVLGPISPRVAAMTGLDVHCRVLCGIHDSNASYLCHLVARPDDPAFTVVSSGTWTIIMARGAAMERLHEERDMLANVDAFGAPVGTVRFMGGREYIAIAGEAPADPTKAALAEVLRRGALALPSFAPAGPFNGHAGRLVNADGLDAPALAALATFYLALLTDFVLDALAMPGAVIIDGPLATNPLYGPLLQGLRPGATVQRAGSRTGPALAARYLALGQTLAPPPLHTVEKLAPPALASCRAAWRALLPS